jgi:dethiobiotin synthetase
LPFWSLRHRTLLARWRGGPVNFDTLSAGLRALEERADWIQVEGAGGWFTPLSASATFADWVVRERLPVILVVGIKPGCINHALLTAQAVQTSGLTLAGWIANNVQPPGRYHAGYLATLVSRLPAPLLGEIPHLPDAGAEQNAGRWLSLAAFERPLIIRIPHALSGVTVRSFAQRVSRRDNVCIDPTSRKQ